MPITPLEAESAVVALLAGKRDEAKHDAATAAAELADIDPRMERVAAELETLAKRRESLRETRDRCEVLAAAYQAAIDRNAPATPSAQDTTADSPAPLFRPFLAPALAPTPMPDPAPPTTLIPAVQPDPRDRCAGCGEPVIWDEQAGFSHEDGTPAGGLCERRWAA